MVLLTGKDLVAGHRLFTVYRVDAYSPGYSLFTKWVTSAAV